MGKSRHVALPNDRGRMMAGKGDFRVLVVVDGDPVHEHVVGRLGYNPVPAEVARELIDQSVDRRRQFIVTVQSPV